ncbi:MAG: hypothetical protein ABIH77_03660 [Pseudomonadota bacterium]|nr:hypothetical protein [Gammaproteobacteria bacterium]
MLKNALYLLLLSMSLVGCSSRYENRYLNSRSIEPMVVPANLSASKIQTTYPIPAVTNNQPHQPMSTTPPNT